MSFKPLAIGLLLPLLLSAAPSRALWLSGSELERHCAALLGDEEGADATLCAAFIQGFLAGADTAERAASTGAYSIAGDAFADRAARTRVGSRLRQTPLIELGYCLGDFVPPSRVIRSVAAYVLARSSAEAQGPDGDPPAQTLVHDALVTLFPCEDG